MYRWSGSSNESVTLKTLFKEKLVEKLLKSDPSGMFTVRVYISILQGYLESGLEFDSTSLPERGPLNFTLGTNTVIPGTVCMFVCRFVGSFLLIHGNDFFLLVCTCLR